MGSFIQKLFNFFATVVIIGLITLGGVVAYHLSRSHMAAGIYRDRLQSLNRDYAELRRTYNEAVQRTAVTELIVTDKTIDVRIRWADGSTKTVPTPYAPGSEIHVDYLVKDGRLWIYRVYSDDTRPNNATFVNPELGHLDWSADNLDVGKGVFRQVTEGRWMVTATGNGSLDLVRRAELPNAELSPPPEVRDYEQIEQQVQQRLDEVGAMDMLKRLFAGEE